MIKREFGIFLVVGLLTVAVDYVTYRGLILSQLSDMVDVAKAVGFITGTVFAYFANRFWTFCHKTHIAGSVWRFSLLYAVTLLINIGINAFALKQLNGLPVEIQAAFLIATGISAVMNFIGMKLFVFRTESLPKTA